MPVGPPVAVGDEPGLYYCHRHKKETTRVTCGRCEKPICTKCIVMSPAGVRCQECARNRVPIRMRGVLHDAGSSVGGAARNVGTRQIWYIWLWSMILRFIMGFFGR